MFLASTAYCRSSVPSASEKKKHSFVFVYNHVIMYSIKELYTFGVYNHYNIYNLKNKAS